MRADQIERSSRISFQADGATTRQYGGTGLVWPLCAGW